MDKYDIPADVKYSIIQQKLSVLRNSLYDTELDALIAERLKDNQLLERSKLRMKDILASIDHLENMAQELEPTQEPE